MQLFSATPNVGVQPMETPTAGVQQDAPLLIIKDMSPSRIFQWKVQEKTLQQGGPEMQHCTVTALCFQSGITLASTVKWMEARGGRRLNKPSRDNIQEVFSLPSAKFKGRFTDVKLAEVNSLCLVSLDLKAHPAQSLLWAGCHSLATFPTQESLHAPYYPTALPFQPKFLLPRHMALSYAAWQGVGSPSHVLASLSSSLNKSLHTCCLSNCHWHRGGLSRRYDRSTHPQVPREKTEQRAS